MKKNWNVVFAILQPLTYIAVVFLGCSILYLGKKEQIQEYNTSIQNFFSLEAKETSLSYNDTNALKTALSQAIEEQKLHAAEEANRIAAEAAQRHAESSGLEAPSEGKHYGNIIIDRLSMNVPLYYGDNNAILRKGAGQYTGSSLPGEGSQILICAHNTSYFKPLQYVVEGDTIRVVTSYGTYTYQVKEIRIALATDTTTYNLSLNYEQLVLYTCYPFTGPPGKTQRYFVYADRII